MPLHAADLIQAALSWLMAIVAVEAATEIVVSSKIFFGLRNALFRAPLVGKFLGELFSCGYCFSVWVSASIAWALPGNILYGEHAFLFNVAIRTLALHRVSNLLHGYIIQVTNRPPKVHMIRMVEDGEPGEAAGEGEGQQP
jgi:hypothetical protein